MSNSTTRSAGATNRAESFSLKALIAFVTVFSAMFGIVVRLVPAHMWFFMIPWTIVLPLQFVSALVAHRNLPRHVPNTSYRDAQRQGTAYTLAVISGLVAVAGWVFLLTGFSLQGSAVTEMWQLAFGAAFVTLVICHVLAHFSLLLSMCFWLAASPRDLRIALLQGLVLVNLAVPTVIYCLIASI